MTGFWAYIKRHHIFALVHLAHTLFRFLDEMTIAISSYLLGVTLLIASADAMSGGILVPAVSTVFLVFAVLQGIGVEAQIRGTAERQMRALEDRHWWRLIGWTLLCAAVAIVAIQATWMFGVEHMDHITEAQALARINLNSTAWWLERAVLGVVLIWVGKVAPYKMPVLKLNTDDVLASIEHERQIALANAELNKAKAVQDESLIHRGRAAKQAFKSPLVVGASTLTAGDAARGDVGDEVEPGIVFGGILPSPITPDDDPEPTPPTRPRRRRTPASEVSNPLSGVFTSFVADDGEDRNVINLSGRKNAGRSSRLDAEEQARRINETKSYLRIAHNMGNKTSVRTIRDHLGISSTSQASIARDKAMMELMKEGYRWTEDGTPAGIQAIAEPIEVSA